MKKKKIYINPIWGSNFNKGINPLMEEINSSIKFDKRLALQDLKVSKAHCQMLKKQKIISAKDYNLIINGLKKYNYKYKIKNLNLIKNTKIFI